MQLIVKIEVDNQLEAYQIVAGLGLEYTVTSAKLGEADEEDLTVKKPANFLKSGDEIFDEFR